MKLKKTEWGIIFFALFCLIGIAYAIDESVTVSYTAKTLTLANYTQFQRALIRTETNSIRFTLDGITTPTSAGVGIKLEIGESLNLPNQDLIIKFKAVRSSSTDAALKVTYW